MERDQPVEEKQVVVTSGFGQIFPKGIPIGHGARASGEEDVNIYKQIEVRPFVDFRASGGGDGADHPLTARRRRCSSLVPATTDPSRPASRDHGHLGRPRRDCEGALAD